MCLLSAWLWEAWPQEGETFTQAQQRFQTQTTEAGLSLFSDFFLVAMGVCMTAALPAAFMVWRGRDGDNPDGPSQGIRGEGD